MRRYEPLPPSWYRTHPILEIGCLDVFLLDKWSNCFFFHDRMRPWLLVCIPIFFYIYIYLFYIRAKASANICSRNCIIFILAFEMLWVRYTNPYL